MPCRTIQYHTTPYHIPYNTKFTRSIFYSFFHHQNCHDICTIQQLYSLNAQSALPHLTVYSCFSHSCCIPLICCPVCFVFLFLTLFWFFCSDYVFCSGFCYCSCLLIISSVYFVLLCVFFVPASFVAEGLCYVFFCSVSWCCPIVPLSNWTGRPCSGARADRACVAPAAVQRAVEGRRQGGRAVQGLLQQVFWFYSCLLKAPK